MEADKRQADKRQADLSDARIAYSGNPGVYIIDRRTGTGYGVGEVWYSGGVAIGRVYSCGRTVSENAYPTLAAARRAVRKAGRHLLPQIARWEADLIASVSE